MFDFATFDHLVFPIFVLEVGADAVPRHAAYNQQARKISGRPLSDYLGRTALEVHPGTLGSVSYAEQCEAARSGEVSAYELELPIGGLNRMIKITLSPMHDTNGNVRWLFGSLQDVSIQHNAAVAQETFERLSHEMTQYVAIAAHDLRAPMRNVALLTDMLRDDATSQHDRPEDGQMDVIDLLEEVAQTSLMLITDVLRSAQEAQEPQKTSVVDLQELCSSLATILDLKNAHKITAPPIQLQADHSLIQIALRNIIENAIKHAKCEHVIIDVAAYAGATNRIEMTIRDNGSCFSRSALAFLDGGKFQIDSGYGLFAVKRLVTSRGGMIRIHNIDDGSGALVELTLPGTLIEDTSPTVVVQIPRNSDTSSLRPQTK